MAQDERDETLRELDSIRQSIDNIDAALVHLLAERFKFTQQVGRLKATHGLPPADPERERRQIQRLRSLAEGARLDPAFAEKWFNFVVAEVIHHHVILAGDQNSAQAPDAAATKSADAHSGQTATSGPKPGPAHPTARPSAPSS